ncbi:cell wall-binding repeat-containing protein [Kineococcus sp. SYSU DK002]|uniref:cell wall-binding repeat-containing protein n=1 Tax=Kineococcus sp. SYSU DK002 TaxID=3383123 RepID=UPI003D7C92A0
MSRSTRRSRWSRAAAAALTASAVVAVAAPAVATPIRAHQTFGTDRYLTSLVLEDSPRDAGRAYLVTGENFPDGLTAAAVAGAGYDNIYLVPKGQITAEVRDRLTYHEEIVVVGGENSVSAEAMTWLQQNTRARLQRVQGADRFETAAALARFAYPSGAAHIVIATGDNYPDALAGSAAAAKVHAPMLLTGRDGLPAATVQALKDLVPLAGGYDVTVLGSDKAVSAAVLEQVRAAAPAGTSVRRIEGADRYETSAAVARAYFTARDTDRAVMVSGLAWADAITGGAYAGRHGAPVLLTPPTCVPQSVNLTIEALNVHVLEAVGGPTTLSDDARLRTSCGVSPRTYLDQLPWPTGNARFLSDHATIDGVFYPRAASFDTDPRNSEYRTWRLQGKFTQFTATAGLLDGNASGLRVTIDVYGDEKLLSSRTVTAGSSAVFDVPVAGVDNLKVVSTSSARNALNSTDNVVYLGDAAVR